MTDNPYQIGTMFLVIDDHGEEIAIGQVLAMDYDHGIIARFRRKGDRGFQSGEPFETIRLSDTALFSGQWKQLEHEPVPQITVFRFVRKNMFGQEFVTEYNMNCELVAETKVNSGEQDHLPVDGLSGHLVVEHVLKQKFCD